MPDKIPIVTPKGDKLVSFTTKTTSPQLSNPSPWGIVKLPVDYYADDELREKEREACKVWGIDQTLLLHTLACDFYLLLDLEIDFPDNPKVKELKKEVVDTLADQLSRYLDMAIGGELRYCWSNTRDLWDVFGGDKEVTEFLHYLKDRGHDTESKSNNRADKWHGWKEIRNKWETKALDYALRILTEPRWNSNFGGSSWANATSVLLGYYTGEYSPVFFVDTALGLHHNSNIIYDKVWNIEVLVEVLDKNVEGNNFDYMEETWASQKVRELRRQLKGFQKPQTTLKQSRVGGSLLPTDVAITKTQ